MKTPRDTTFEMITQAGAFLDFLPPSRARSMVGTKLDEAILWLTQVDPDGQLTDEGQAQAGEPHFDKKQAASGIEALAQYASSPEKQVRTAARLWRDTVRNLDHSNMIRATSEMRTIIARIEAEAGLIKPKTDDMASNIVASSLDPSPFLDIMERAEEQKKTASLDEAQGPAVKPRVQDASIETLSIGDEDESVYERMKGLTSNEWLRDAMESSDPHRKSSALLIACVDAFAAMLPERSRKHTFEARDALYATLFPREKPKSYYCMICNDTGWVPRAPTGTILAGVPFSSNYKPCPAGCDGGRGHSDPIPYDPKTGKIVAPGTEDDGA